MTKWRRGRAASASVEGGEHCDLCGQVVFITDDGFCRLGHRVGTPLSALPEPDDLTFPDLGPDLGFETPPAPAADVPSEPDADPLTAAELFADAGQGFDLAAAGTVAPPAPHDTESPPPCETPEERPANPYDELLGWDPPEKPLTWAADAAHFVEPREEQGAPVPPKW